MPEAVELLLLYQDQTEILVYSNVQLLGYSKWIHVKKVTVLKKTVSGFCRHLLIFGYTGSMHAYMDRYT